MPKARLCSGCDQPIDECKAEPLCMLRLLEEKADTEFDRYTAEYASKLIRHLRSHLARVTAQRNRLKLALSDAMYWIGKQPSRDEWLDGIRERCRAALAEIEGETKQA